MTCSRARFCASSRASSSSSTAAASDAALASPLLRLRQRSPPNRERSVDRRVAGAYRVPRGTRQLPWLLSLGWPHSTSTPPTGQHFHEHGWVVVDALPPRARSRARGAGSTRSPRSPTASRRAPTPRATDAGPQLCRSENFVDVHAGLRDAAVHRTARRGRGRAARRTGGALQGEDQLQARRVAPATRAHQDAPAYPMIDVARVGDDRGRRRRRDERRPRGGVGLLRRGAAHSTSAGASSRRSPTRSTWEPVAVPAGRTLWFHSRTPHRSARQPLGSRPRRALVPHLQRRARGRPPRRVLRDEAGRVRADADPATARWSRSSATSKGGRHEGRVHRARRAPGSPRRRRAHAGPGTSWHGPVAVRPAGRASVMTSATYPEPRHLRHRHRARATTASSRTGCRRPGRSCRRGSSARRVPTLFDACRAAGRSSAAVFGDQYLVGVMGARTADRHWPPDGVPPAERPTRRARLHRRPRHHRRAGRRARRRVPTSWSASSTRPTPPPTCTAPTARRRWPCYRETDALLARSRDHLDWDDTVWILVSDHDQEDARRPRARSTSGRSSPGAGSICSRSPRAAPPSSAATARTTARAWLAEVDGVEGTAPFHVADAELECCLAWSVAGRAFGFAGDGHRARHPRRPPHPRAGRGRHRRPPSRGTAGATRSRDRRITAADWAPTVAALLDLDAPDRDRSLAALTAYPGERRERVRHATSFDAAGDARRRRPSGSTPCPRTLAASSARRSATRSSRSGRRSNAGHLGRVHDPALERRASPRSGARAARRSQGRWRAGTAWRRRARRPGRHAVTEQLAARARDRRRRARRRAAASSRRPCARATRGRARGPRPGARRRRDATMRSSSAHCRQCSRIDSPPSSSASRDASSASNSASTSANGLAHNEAASARAARTASATRVSVGP